MQFHSSLCSGLFLLTNFSLSCAVLALFFFFWFNRIVKHISESRSSWEGDGRGGGVQRAHHHPESGERNRFLPSLACSNQQHPYIASHCVLHIIPSRDQREFRFGPCKQKKFTPDEHWEDDFFSEMSLIVKQNKRIPPKKFFWGGRSYIYQNGRRGGGGFSLGGRGL